MLRPEWWMGVNGAEPKLPKRRYEGQKVNFDGFVLEEIFWNWKNNPLFKSRDLDMFISQGNSPTLQIMKRWNAHKAEWFGLPRVPIRAGMPKSYQECWRKYHDYLDKGGDPTVHEDFNAKHPPTGNGCKTCAARAGNGCNR
jgi:hypothetical protein